MKLFGILLYHNIFYLLKNIKINKIDFIKFYIKFYHKRYIKINIKNIFNYIISINKIYKIYLVKEEINKIYKIDLLKYKYNQIILITNDWLYGKFNQLLLKREKEILK